MRRIGACLAAFVTGCATVPAIDPSALPVTPEAFKEPGVRGSAPLPADGAWWRVFNDPILNSLVARALERNNDIHSARARHAQARAIAARVDSRRAPQAGAVVSLARGHDTTLGRDPRSTGRASLDFEYEVDLFGKLAEASRAAALDAEASASLVAASRLLVQAAVARSYFDLRALDAERSLVRETVLAYRDSLALVERRHAAGDVAELDVARVRVEVASNEAEAFALDRRRTQTEHLLAVLIGEAPSSFAVGERDWETPLPSVPPGIPSAVLGRRPDIAAARTSVMAAQSRIGVAKAAWLPNLTLSGAAGYASGELGDLLAWSARSWGVGALLALPIFDGGRREAGVGLASAELDFALASYRDSVLSALREVEDQLASLRLLAEQAEAQRRAVDASLRATRLSEIRYRSGFVSQLDLLDARRGELRNRRQAVQLNGDQYQATVGLIRALGGGWTSPQRP